MKSSSCTFRLNGIRLPSSAILYASFCALPLRKPCNTLLSYFWTSDFLTLTMRSAIAYTSTIIFLSFLRLARGLGRLSSGIYLWLSVLYGFPRRVISGHLFSDKPYNRSLSQGINHERNGERIHDDHKHYI